MSAVWSNDPEPEGGGTVTRPQCMTCARRRTLDTCTAFPQGIPLAIQLNHADHRQPYPGDHGERWEPDPEDAVHPMS
jgi:hypothetical protein